MGYTRVRISEIPALIEQRHYFDTDQYRLYAYTDAAGNYAVYSYGKPVLTIDRQGRVRTTRGYVFKNHREMLGKWFNGREEA